jgi:hypothetical protein
MKKIFYFLTSLSLIVVNSSFLHINKYNKAFLTKKNFVVQNQIAYAYVYFNGSWIKGEISYFVTREKIIPISYKFEKVGNNRFVDKFYGDKKFIPLDPNSQIARQNNWTHSIIIHEGLRLIAYLNLN